LSNLNSTTISDYSGTGNYVEVGSSVKKGQPLCILEAMKLMNTLEAECDGVIEEILVQNGDLVEFDQPIFKIRKVA
jgi:acetyl-CoA carboxylase biotin carboxyl carrier protein